MTDPVITWIGSPNYRNITSQKHGVVFHWIVGYLGSADARFVQPRQTATQYAVGPNAIHQYVADELYAPGTGHNGANTNYISIEHEAGYIVDGARYSGAAATLENSAQLVAFLSRKHGWGKMVPGVNAFGHSDFVSTECPGTLPWHWICDRANEINGQPAAPTNPGGAVTAGGGNSYPTGTYNGYPIKEIQAIVGADQDSVYGPDTTAKVKVWQAANGLDPDGIVGPLTWGKMHGAAAPAVPAPAAPAAPTAPAFPLPAGSYFGPRSGPAASVSGYFSHREDLRRWQNRMKARGWEITADGLYGDQTANVATSFQAEKHLQVDAKIGPQTWSAAWTAPVT